MSSAFPLARAALACATLFAAFPSHSEPIARTEHVEAQLVTEKAAAKPGSTFVVGLRLRMEPQWHTYWINPGDSGLPTKIKWTLPAGWKAGAIQWPYPQKLPVGPLMNYGYEDEVILLTDISVPADAAAGSANLKADVEWLVCKDICIPEKGALDLSVPVANAQPADDPRYQAGIDRARNQLPVDPSGWKYDAAIRNGMLAVRLTAPEGTQPPAKLFFFPERENLIDPAAPEKFTREGRSVTVEMKLADPPLANVQSVRGVAFSESGWQGASGHKAIEVAANVGASLPGAVAGTAGGGEVASGASGSTLAALAFAFIGGILLNLMPCVFPVLGIKVMGFVEHAHGDERAMRLQGIVFGIGVLVSFLVLAGLMLAMRAGGAQLGWGFQLQSPAFVMVLAVLFFVLALNLSGVFEWGAFAQSMTSNLSARGRYADALLSGVLATVVATPCTAPFMGAAVGFTLTQDAALSLVVFAVLGIGMALPVVMLSFFPGLLRKLPRPGAWMETFKQVLAFPLYATVAWLAWVIGAQAGNDAILALLGGLVLVAMGAWAYGRWAASPGFAHTVFAAMLVAAGVAVAWPSSHPQGTETAAGDEAGWEAWSPEKVRSLTAQGHAVFVDFTAAWCVTCQVNKRLALHDADVVKAFAARDVVRLKADWTRQDPRITAALAELGRNAVPVYALYVPGEDKPRLLPEVLTPSLVLGEIAKLPAGKGATAVTQR